MRGSLELGERELRRCVFGICSLACKQRCSNTRPFSAVFAIAIDVIARRSRKQLEKALSRDAQSWQITGLHGARHCKKRSKYESRSCNTQDNERQRRNRVKLNG